MNFTVAVFVLFGICLVGFLPGLIMLIQQSKMPHTEKRMPVVYGGLFLSISSLVVFFLGVITLTFFM